MPAVRFGRHDAAMWVLVLVQPWACSSTSSTDASTATSAGSGSGSSTGASAADSASAGSGSSADSGGFVADPDGGAPVSCNLYRDECPMGRKCSPFASDGGMVPNAARCVDVVASPQQGAQACTMQEWPASGLDDCDRGLTCVVYDAETLDGTCVALCIEDPEQPDLVCADTTARCVGPPDAIPRLCTSSCDPFGADCPGDRGCYRIQDHFTCLDDASGPGGAYGEPCIFTNQCDSGMLCADPPEFFECGNAEGCCTPFCDTRDPDASASCPGAPEHMCVRLFDPGDGPPLYDWVGACVVPTEGGP